MEILKDNVSSAFCGFYKEVKKTKANSLALEIIYSTYLAYFRKNNKSKIAFLSDVISHSSFSMLLIGCKLFFHLLQRKVKSLF